MQNNEKQIGSLNGKWAFLMKLFLATWPFFLGWMVWMTSETFINRAFRQAGDRFTLSMAIEMEARMRKDLSSDIRSMNATIQANSHKLSRIEAFWEKEHGIR